MTSVGPSRRNSKKRDCGKSESGTSINSVQTPKNTAAARRKLRGHRMEPKNMFECRELSSRTHPVPSLSGKSMPRVFFLLPPP